ncbi:hypothetical protein D3C86_2162750 [compost metagenome]
MLVPFDPFDHQFAPTGEVGDEVADAHHRALGVSIERWFGESRRRNAIEFALELGEFGLDGVQQFRFRLGHGHLLFRAQIGIG